MSPAATLTDEEATVRLLSAADELFYRYGVGAVTMASVRDAAGVSLRRLYSLHPTKSDLVSAWLRYRHERWTAGFRAGVLERRRNGEPPADAVFGALEDWMIATEFRGCGFINTHAEGNELTDEHRTIIRAHKRELAEMLPSLAGFDDDGERAGSLAVLLDGAIVQASIFASTEPIRSARRAATALLEHAP